MAEITPGIPQIVATSVASLMEIISIIQSLCTVADSAGGIYSTAMGEGNKYDKAEAFAHDATMLAVSLIFIWATVFLVKNCKALFKSASQNLIGRTTRITPAEVVNNSKDARMISSMGEFLDYTKGFLDEDALLYAKEVLGDDADDTAQLKNIAQLIEDGSGKIGKKLSKEELKAGLDALWDDGGAEGALGAIEQWSKGGGVTVVKETNQFVEYANRAGQKIRIPKQSRKSIDNTIAEILKRPDVGDQTEAKVAHFIRNDMGKELTDFRNKVKNSNKKTIGEIDCGMEDVLIEVKKSIADVETEQFDKYINYNDERYINVLNKKVVLYIDKPMENICTADQEKLQNIEKMGVTIVNGLEELKGVLE